MKLGPGTRQALALLGIALLLCGTYAWAQNLGAAPQSNVAVQGETGAQPEGAFLNFIRAADLRNGGPRATGGKRHRAGRGWWRSGGSHRSLAHGPGLWTMAIRRRSAAGRLRSDPSDRILD